MKNILEHWKTTLIGVLLLIAGVVFFALGKIDFTQLMIFLPFVVGFAFAKDSFLPGGGAAAMFILLLGFTSCITYEKCADKFGISTDTVIIKSDVFVPKDSIITVTKIEQITKLQPSDTVYITDHGSRAQIKYWYNKYTQTIGVKAICDTLTIHDTVAIAAIIDKNGNILRKGDKAPFKKWVWLGLGAFITLITLLIFKKIFGNG